MEALGLVPPDRQWDYSSGDVGWGGVKSGLRALPADSLRVSFMDGPTVFSLDSCWVQRQTQSGRPQTDRCLFQKLCWGPKHITHCPAALSTPRGIQPTWHCLRELLSCHSR